MQVVAEKKDKKYFNAQELYHKEVAKAPKDQARIVFHKYGDECTHTIRIGTEKDDIGGPKFYS